MLKGYQPKAQRYMIVYVKDMFGIFTLLEFMRIYSTCSKKIKTIIDQTLGNNRIWEYRYGVNHMGIVISVIIVTTIVIFSLCIISKQSNKKAAKLYLDKMIKDGNIVLPDCEYAYECYLYEYVNFNTFPECETCKDHKLRKDG